MSEDEFIVLVLSTGIAAFWTKTRLSVAFRSGMFTTNRQVLFSAGIVFALCLSFIWWVLSSWAAHDVVDSPIYKGFYFIVGLAWIALFLGSSPWIGLSFRDDILERGNSAACLAVLGYLIATTLIYSMANTGDGPGWWCVVVAAFLSQATLIIGWIGLMLVTNLFEEISVDRDFGSALRTGSWFVASGMVLGRAAAGTWTSFDATVVEFLQVARYFPLLMIAAALLELGIRLLNDPHPDRNPYLTGFSGAFLYMGLALWILQNVGSWT